MAIKKSFQIKVPTAGRYTITTADCNSHSESYNNMNIHTAILYLTRKQPREYKPLPRLTQRQYILYIIIIIIYLFIKHILIDGRKQDRGTGQ